MKSSTSTCLITIVLAYGMLASSASAQNASATPTLPVATTPPPIQVTPFVAIDSRGSSPVGVAVEFPVNSTFSIETEVGYRQAEGHLDALSSSASLLYALPQIGRVTPYVAAGAGLAQYGTPIVSREGSLIGTQSRTAFEINAGGGVKVPVSDTWDMRTDARWFKSFGRHGSEHWRLSHGVSFDTKR